MMDKPTDLYRHWDKDGRLLYVGISLSATQRLAAHMHGSHWSDSIASVTIDRYPDRMAALHAEREAIETEGPLHNLMHNPAKKRSGVFSRLPPVPAEFNDAYLDGWMPVLACNLSDAEEDRFIVTFTADGLAEVRMLELEWITLNEDALGYMTELCELARVWFGEAMKTDEMQAALEGSRAPNGFTSALPRLKPVALIPRIGPDYPAVIRMERTRLTPSACVQGGAL
jgi:hypothetical protein